MFKGVISFLLATTTAVASESNVSLRTAAEINDFYAQKYPGDATFEIEGSLRPDGGTYIFQDATGSTQLTKIATNPPSAACSAKLTGRAQFKNNEAFVRAHSATITGEAAFRPPVDLKIGEIEPSRLCFTEVRTTGLVVDAHKDDVDARFTILLLKDGNAYLPVSFPASRYTDPTRFVGARVEAAGMLLRAIRGTRKFSGPIIADAHISTLVPSPADPFDAPLLQRSWYTMTPSDIAALDRHLVRGRVLAIWDGDHLLIRDADSNLFNVILDRPSTLPKPDVIVECVGYPQTDLFRITLTNARWRPFAGKSSFVPADTPTPPSTADSILLGTNGCKRVDGDHYGKLIRLIGIVRSLPDAASPDRRLYLDSGRFKVPVDFSNCSNAADGIKIGSEIEVTGRCIIETTGWSPSAVFPQATSIFLVVRSAADFKVLRAPSWWTPARFVAALLVLLAALVVIFLWNLSLQVLVKRRARQIFKADLARVTSELRVEDRTRLAVELHDALSQNLTGVSMEIEAATRYGTEEPENLMRHLQVADKVLKSCRTELRNSLWDLRNQALEEHDINEAIRRTLLPHIKNVKLNVRFQVPRARLTDNTTHEILHIIRELAVNGISHGGANEIRIAGSIEDETLLFSVRDNGTGFDPDTAPGVLQGHFGLKGVQDRLRRLSGKLELNSVIGKGTRAVVSLRPPQAQKKDSPS